MSARMASAPDAPSPSPSTMPPPNKRPRPSGAAAGGGAGGGGGGAGARTKRAKKVEEPLNSDDDMGDSQKKGKEGEDGELHTKIDFRDLPDETLYKYLEMHALLPTWQRPPWSEQTMQRPSELYPKESDARAPSPARPNTSLRRGDSGNPGPIATQAGEEAAGADEEAADGEDVDMSGRATRSKTAPQRKEATPLIAASSEVITLSDVQAARDVLADKANQHWVKGLGGGQNKESETIVNFLYKLKVGPGRLLKVYNPTPAVFTSRV